MVKSFKYLITFFAGITALAVVALVALWFVPSLILNQQSLEWGRRYVQGKGIFLEWKSAEIEASPLHWLMKRLRFRSEDLCFNIPEQGVSGCVESVSFTLDVGWQGAWVRVSSLGSLSIRRGRWNYLVEKTAVSGTFQVAPQSVSGTHLLEINGTLSRDKKPDTFSVRAELGPYQPAEWKALVHGKVSQRQGPIKDISVNDCVVQWTSESTRNSVALNCGLAALFRFNSKGSVTATLVAKLDLDEEKYSIDSTVALAEFQRIVRVLEPSPWAIAQPFSNLKGKVIIKAAGKGIVSDDGNKFSITVTTDLSSPSQRLNLLATSELPLGKSEERLNVDIRLEDVVLALPPLDLKTPPRILPDSRIRTTAEEQSSAPSEFKYRIRVHTANETSAHLRSRWAKAKIPISLDVVLADDAEAAGVVQIRAFPLELFRRKARVDFVKITLDPQTDQSVIHARLEVVYTDYTISILIDGPISQPLVHFLSNPPLPEKQLIAVLLFGKEIDALNSDEMSSVGNTRAALADGAVSLASMYALASTPVESVGYDPGSQVFTAKVRLADGTSLNIGSDLKQVNRFGVKKRLGPHWDISTYIENPLFAAERSLTSLLEWHWRY